jgi:cyanamide hydratase
MGDQVASNGWTAVPVDASKIFHDGTFRKPDPILVNGIEFPSDPLVLEVQAYAKDHLPWETYNHSMRVFYFGQLLFTFGPEPTPRLV